MTPGRAAAKKTNREANSESFLGETLTGTDGSQVLYSDHSLMMVKQLNTGEPIKFAGNICCSNDLAFSSCILILYFSCHN